MRKIVVSLPTDLMDAVGRAARSEKISKAAFIRRALERAVFDGGPPKPRLPLFSSNVPDLTNPRHLRGFGGT